MDEYDELLELKERGDEILDETGLVCTITKNEARGRAPNIQYIRNQVEEVKEIDKGYAAIFPYNEEIAHSLLDFIVKEHDCCPFFPFDLSFRKKEDKISFSVDTGDNEQSEEIAKLFTNIFHA